MNRRLRFPLLLIGLLCFVVVPAGAAEPVDLDAVNAIRDEGLHRSRVMDHAWRLTEGNGPRLTASPGHRAAAELSRDLMASWGLDARLEEVEFGSGWSLERAEVRMVAPHTAVLEALPKAWTPGTEGPVRGRAVQATLESEEDLETWRGKLTGAVVLLDPAQDFELDQQMFKRYTADQLAEYKVLEIPQERDRNAWRKRFMKQWGLWPKLAAYLADQVAMVGAHLDSWHAGTGATHNGGNCAVVMEAVRLLTAAGVTPRRTIRVALWMGEEQGLLGSRHFVERYLAPRPVTRSCPASRCRRRRRTTSPTESIANPRRGAGFP